jgi:HSP20 family protein
MAITRWAPFSAFTSLEREMQTLGRELRSLLAGGSLPEAAWRPDIDVYREGDNLVVRAELPGIDPAENLEIDVEDNVLRIRGHKRFEREVDEEHRFLRECRFGSFERDVLLPEDVVPDDVEAVYENGVLTVRVPVPAEVAISKKVPIRVEDRTSPASRIKPD